MVTRLRRSWAHFLKRRASARIHTRVTAIVLVLLMLFACAVIIGVRATVEAAMYDEHRARAVLAAQDLAERMATAVAKGDRAPLCALLRGYAKSDPDVAYALVVNRSQNVLADTFDQGPPDVLLTANALGRGERSTVVVWDTEQGRVWDVAVPIQDGSLGTVRLGISQVACARHGPADDRISDLGDGQCRVPCHRGGVAADGCHPQAPRGLWRRRPRPSRQATSSSESRSGVTMRWDGWGPPSMP